VHAACCMLHDDKVHVLYMHLVVCTIAYSYSDCACLRACFLLTDTALCLDEKLSYLVLSCLVLLHTHTSCSSRFHSATPFPRCQLPVRTVSTSPYPGLSQRETARVGQADWSRAQVLPLAGVGWR
jgi:hypothetical protein